MKRRGRNPNENPGVRPVEKIELSEKHIKLRVICAALFLIIGVILIARAVGSLFSESDGWREITVDPMADANCGNDFVFQYYLGNAGVSATAEYKVVAADYTDACVKANRLFDCMNGYDGVFNMYYINVHPNTEVKVDEVLYKAFELLGKYDSRILYGAPMYEEYKNLFFSRTDAESADFDVFRNDKLRSYFSDLSEYVKDPEKIELRLLGEGRVTLFVSDDYLEFARENAIGAFIDFFWTKNAFIVDYIAGLMQEKGHTFGNISSFDGFVRNLDDSERSYSFNIIDRVDNANYVAGRMTYIGKVSLVYLRTYPLSEVDDEHYYTLENGKIRHPYIDISDGLCKSSLANMISFSKEFGCAETLLNIVDSFVSDSFESTGLTKAQKIGIYSIYCLDRVIYSNSSSVTVSDLYKRDGVEYISKTFQ